MCVARGAADIAFGFDIGVCVDVRDNRDTGELRFELAYIFIQAGAAQHSHFNLETAFHVWMYRLMAIGAVTLIAAAAVIGVLVWRFSEADAVLRRGVGATRHLLR